MFEPYYEICELEPGKQEMCCMKLIYMQDTDFKEGQVQTTDIYVRCYITKIDTDTYMVTFCERSLNFSNKFYVRIFNRRNLPPLYKLPLLWALSNNVITFTKEGRVNFVKDRYGKTLRTIDVFDSKDCIDRLTYIELCKNKHCPDV